MRKRKFYLGSIATLITIAAPIIAATSCGIEQRKETPKNYSFSGEIYQGNTQELNSSFVKSLKNFRKEKVDTLWKDTYPNANDGTFIDEFFSSHDQPIVTYDFSSANIDHLSPEIFKYMKYEKYFVRIKLILRNNNFKSFDFSILPPFVSIVDLSNNKFTGKLDLSSIDKTHALDVNLSNNNLSSVDYDEIKKYIKNFNNKSEIKSINIFAGFKKNLSWRHKGSWYPRNHELQILATGNNFDKVEFEKNWKLINNVKHT